jgi:two-component system chemotaxis response regulator CheY
MINKTVLIVDDSEMVRKILTFTLKSAGYTILQGKDGDDALENFDGKDIDLVITDLHMPNKDGLQLKQDIRGMEYYKFLPIILFQSNITVDVKDFMKFSGATILFDKNSIREQLVPTVKKMIG